MLKLTVRIVNALEVFSLLVHVNRLLILIILILTDLKVLPTSQKFLCVKCLSFQ